MRCRGSLNPDLLRPAGLQFRRPPGHAGNREAGHRRLRGLRLRRRPVGLLRRHAQVPLCRAVRRRAGLEGAGGGLRRQGPRAGQLPPRRPRHARSRGAVRRHGHLSRLLLGPSRARGPRPAAQAAQVGRGAEARRAARRRRLLRLRRHVLRQVSRHLQCDRREEDRSASRRPAPARCSPATSAAS